LELQEADIGGHMIGDYEVRNIEMRYDPFKINNSIIRITIANKSEPKTRSFVTSFAIPDEGIDGVEYVIKQMFQQVKSQISYVDRRDNDEREG
jgi:hypothetical protein